MFVASVSKSAWHAVGEQIGSLLAAVYKTFSETGQVKLASRDWRAEPIVEFNLLSDRRDLERLMDAFRRLGAMQIEHGPAAKRRATRSRRATPSGCARSASSTPRTSGSPT